MALTIFEVAVVELAICPVEAALPVFLPRSPLALVHRTVWPLEEAPAIHLIELELALEDLPPGGDTSAQPMCVTVLEASFVNRAIREDLDTATFWFSRQLGDFSAEVCSTASAVEILYHGLFRAVIGLSFKAFLEEVERAKLLVDLNDHVIV